MDRLFTHIQFSSADASSLFTYSVATVPFASIVR